ncbi:MAG: AAA family ATPase, partial [Pseudomonadota bacterium]
GEGASQEQAVVGGTPNLAARLQGLAEPGQVVIAEATRRLVGAGFDCSDLGPQTLKGLDEPVVAFAVTGERAMASRFEAQTGRLLPMVGRNQELALLLERWEQAKAGEGQGVLLVGEAGIGKSRITRALLDALAEEPHVRIRYQCSPYHADSALWPVVQQLRHAAGLAAEDTSGAQLDKLEALLAQADGDIEGSAPLVADLLGLSGAGRYGPIDLPAQAQRARTLAALVDQLLGLAARQPVLVVLEDAHWTDPTTLEMIEQALEQISDARVLMLVTSRPDQQPELATHPHVTALTLNRLGRTGVEAIVDRLGGQALSADVVDAIIARTDGIPLFVEELTKAVLETGEAEIPASLHDSLMARLDRIPEVKEVAQIAACIGREFDYPLLAAVVEPSGIDLERVLDRLVDAELIFRRGRSRDAHYLFKHALVRDAAYASLLRRRRQAIHVRIAAVLERHFGAMVEASPELLAQHLTEGDRAERAIPLWLTAGERAARRSANVEAIAAFQNGLELLRRQPDAAERMEKELAFQLGLGPVLMAARGLVGTDVGAAYERARQLCEIAGSDEQTWPVLFGLSRYHLMRGEIEAAKQRAHELTALAHRHPGCSLPAWWAEGVALFWGGDIHLAGPFLSRVVESYDSELHHAMARQCAADPGVVCTSFSAWASWMRGYPDQASEFADRAVELAEALGHPHSITWAACFRAKCRLFR